MARAHYKFSSPEKWWGGHQDASDEEFFWGTILLGAEGGHIRLFFLYEIFHTWESREMLI